MAIFVARLDPTMKRLKHLNTVQKITFSQTGRTDGPTDRQTNRLLELIRASKNTMGSKKKTFVIFDQNTFIKKLKI